MGNCLKLPDPLGDSIERNTEIDVSALKAAKLPIVFVVGGPGSGKGEPYPVGRGPGGDTIFTRYWLPSGTQCEKIAKEFGYLHISSGDLLRQEVDKGTKRGSVIGRIMDQGRLVPMDIMVELIKEKMLSAMDSCRGFLIEGYPREKDQAKYFEDCVRPVDLVIHYVVRDEVLRDRLLGRAVTSDRLYDDEETIEKRIKLFRKHSDAVVKYYAKKLVLINGERDVHSVFEDTRQAIDSLTHKFSDK